MSELAEQFKKTNRSTAYLFSFFLTAAAHSFYKKSNFNLLGRTWLLTAATFVPINILSAGVFVNRAEDEKFRLLASGSARP